MQRAPDERVTRARSRARSRGANSSRRWSPGRSAASAPTTCWRSKRSTPRPAMSWRASRSRSPVKEQVLTSLGTATAQLREKLGESLASIQKFDVPLPRATTPSLEALHAYSLALDQGRVIRGVEAIPHLKRAIELDPDFAMAQALLSGVYANTGQSRRGAGVCAPGVRAARPRQRARAVLDFVALLHRRRPGLGQGARPCPRPGPRRIRAKRSRSTASGIASGAFGQHERGGRRVPRSHPSRRQVRRRRMETWSGR